jgi:curli production assembly/transport component CsgG
LSPFVFGFGFGTNKIFENRHSKIQYGAGLEYLASSKIELRLSLNKISILVNHIRALRDDYYFRFGLGLTIIQIKTKKNNIITNSKKMMIKDPNMNRNVLPLVF